MREEKLPVYAPETPAWIRPRGIPTTPAEPGREDGVVALALGTCAPADPNSEVKGTFYGVEGSPLVI